MKRLAFARDTLHPVYATPDLDLVIGLVSKLGNEHSENIRELNMRGRGQNKYKELLVACDTLHWSYQDTWTCYLQLELRLSPPLLSVWRQIFSPYMAQSIAPTCREGGIRGGDEPSAHTHMCTTTSPFA